MRIATTKHSPHQTVQIPIGEYRVLKGLYEHIKQQSVFLRILEAEENFAQGRVKRMSSEDFIESL